ncbi:MAG: DUF1428 family protein [Gammaproteobacteria bacterium]|jgi:uncharacterized protein YbaA (DUF1428 family)|nr:DUF1428 family protein [Gammaproteobacteria bacterium]
MAYVDGFVVPVKKARVDEYKKLAELADEVWREHGAIAYVECLADDVPDGELTSFPRAVQLQDDEVVGFAWIVYRSREQRDEVNRKVMEDPRIRPQQQDWPFEGRRLIFGGFVPFIGL